MLTPDVFLSESAKRGYAFFSGVPCSFLKSFINFVIDSDEITYIAASSEGEAVGIASGAYLAGRKAGVICQNSGLGNAVNPLTSLNYPFRIPLLLMVTLRGEPGLNDEPQHELMGRITGRLLDTLEIPWVYLPTEESEIPALLDHADALMESDGSPFALVQKKGAFSQWKSQVLAGRPVKLNHAVVPWGSFGSPISQRMHRVEAIRIVRDSFSESDAFVATTGKIGRELYTIGDSPSHLYVVGSMGCASAIGLGIKSVLPNQKVIVLDGDGAALMKMGSLATIGHYAPKRFVHVILDNEAYESTGGQATASPTVDFAGVAGACGYAGTFRADDPLELSECLKATSSVDGPALIHVKVSSGSDPSLARPAVRPEAVKLRFMSFLKERNQR